MPTGSGKLLIKKAAIEVLLFLLIILYPAPANLFAAISPDYAAVAAAVSAADSGDTVEVGPGAATWDNQLVITKGIILKGAGATSTYITSNYTALNPGNTFNEGNFLIVYKPSLPVSNEPFRLTGFSLNMNDKCGGIVLSNTAMSPINCIRIDHNSLSHATSPYGSMRCIMFNGHIFGVVDNNALSDNAGGMSAYGLDSPTWNTLAFGYGSVNNTYFEDNTFVIYDNPHSGGAGGRYCARYNTYTYTNTSQGLMPLYDMHGNQPVGNCAQMGAEVYGNIVTATANVGIRLFDHRGGKALVFCNRVDTLGAIDATVREEYNDSLNPPATSPLSGQPQHISASYYWKNLKNGSTLINAAVTQTVDYGSPLGLVPQENREFWNEQPAFDGTLGLGVGTLVNRPVTCVPGVGYWATDQNFADLSICTGAHPNTPIAGTLYLCDLPNHWIADYTPYTYPHPLRVSGPLADEPSATAPPAPPKRLRVK